MSEDQELAALRARVAQLEAGGQKPKAEGGGLMAGCGWVILFILVMVVLMMTFARLNPDPEVAAADVAPPPVPPSQRCNEDHAKGQMMLAMGRGLITGN